MDAFPRPPALHFLLSAGCLLLVGLRPLPGDSLGALWLPERLLWPSLRPRVCESSCLSPWFLPFRGPTPLSRFVPQFGALSESLTYSIPRSFLVESLSAYAGGPFCSSMAMSWHAIRFALVSFVDPVRIVSPLAPCLRCQSQSLACGCSCSGASPLALAYVRAHGVCGGSTFIALHRTWSVSAFCQAPLGAQLGVSYFSCAMFRMYSWRYFCLFH